MSVRMLEEILELLLVNREVIGADICGENGEYHTFVSDGPLYETPVPHTFGKPIRQGQYAILPLK